MNSALEKRTTKIFKDFDGNFYAIVQVAGSKKINAIISSIDINKYQVVEMKKNDAENTYLKVKKSVKKTKKYKPNENLFINHCNDIAPNAIIRELKHYDCAMCFKNDNHDELLFVILLGKTLRELNNLRILKKRVPLKDLSLEEKYLILLFSDFRIIKSVYDYLPLVYYSNSIRYINVLDEIRKQIDSFCIKHKKKIEKSSIVLEKIAEYTKEDDSIKEKYKRLLNDNKTISYGECLEFNSRCMIVQNMAESVLFISYLDLDIDDSDVDLNHHNIQTSRNDCVFYRGSTDMLYGCTPKLYRTPLSNRLENISYHEYVMRFPEKFDNKSSVESITLMQHFGLPTRLLDITTNPLVALFMSCYSGFSEVDDSKTPGEIIVFFPEYNNKEKDNQIKYYDSTRVTLISCIAHLEYEEKTNLRRLCVSPLFREKTIGEILKIESNDIPKLKTVLSKNEFENSKKALVRLLDFVDRENRIKYEDVIISDLLKSYYIKTPSNSERIKAQSGCFILFGLDPEYANQHLKSSRNEKKFFRIIIGDKLNILDELKQLNIHQASMMPDMQNVAGFLSQNKY